MVPVMVLIMVPVMVRFWSVLPERRPVHLLEEPEDGAELGGGAVIHHAAPTRPGVAWARSERARSSGF